MKNVYMHEFQKIQTDFICITLIHMYIIRWLFIYFQELNLNFYLEMFHNGIEDFLYPVKNSQVINLSVNKLVFINKEFN